MAFYYSPPFWSLPAEVEFYALLPLLGWGLGKLGRPWGLPALLMAALAVRVVLLALADGEAENSAYINLHHLPGLLVEFLLGVWAWQLHGRSWTLGKRWAWALSGGSGILVCGVFFHQAQTGPGGPHWSHGQMGLGVAASFALILAATSGLEVKKDGVRRVCDWAGRLSYGTYLLHSAWAMAITGWAAQWGAVAGLSAGAAGLAVSVLALHLTVEEPLRRWGRRMADRLDQKTSVSPG
jgi:peptidoglycan/LPS O-acetylase OafA/YrhL